MVSVLGLDLDLISFLLILLFFSHSGFYFLVCTIQFSFARSNFNQSLALGPLNWLQDTLVLKGIHAQFNEGKTHHCARPWYELFGQKRFDFVFPVC